MTTNSPAFGTRASDPVADLVLAQQAIDGLNWWARAGMTPHWPLSLEEVADLLIGGDYAIDPAGIVYLIERRMLPVPCGDGEAEFDAFDVAQIARVLDARQQWAPGGRFDARKNQTTIALEQARADGVVHEMATASPNRTQFDALALLRMCVECDHREGREAVAALMRAVIENDHGIVI